MPVDWEEFDIDKDQADKDGPGIAEMNALLNDPDKKVQSKHVFVYGTKRIYIKCLIFWEEKE